MFYLEEDRKDEIMLEVLVSGRLNESKSNFECLNFIYVYGFLKMLRGHYL